jgi:hypothetical protein
MSDTTRTGTKVPVQPKRVHDHAWRLVPEPRKRAGYGRFRVYTCDLCPATWTT